MYSHILVAIDLSEDSNQVAASAAKLAQSLDAKLSLVFVEPGVGKLSLMDIELQLESSHDNIQKQHQERLQQVASQLPLETANCVVVCGDVIKQIEATQQRIGADLIVTGEHHGLWHIGHADRSLVKSADCDVLTVKL